MTITLPILGTGPKKKKKKKRLERKSSRSKEIDNILVRIEEMEKNINKLCKLGEKVFPYVKMIFEEKINDEKKDKNYSLM